MGRQSGPMLLWASSLAQNDVSVVLHGVVLKHATWPELSQAKIWAQKMEVYHKCSVPMHAWPFHMHLKPCFRGNCGFCAPSGKREISTNHGTKKAVEETRTWHSNPKLFDPMAKGCKCSLSIPPRYLQGRNKKREGRPGMSDVSPLSEISGMSFASTLLSPLLFFLPSPVTLSVWSFFLPAGQFSWTFSIKLFNVVC